MLIAAYDSAYPGSMNARKDGAYIRRDDATSLAGALLALVTSADLAASDAEAAMAAAHAEIASLQKALAFWLPQVPADGGGRAGKRAADDAMLLVGYQGDVGGPIAQDLGWIAFLHDSAATK